jgi:hypothetical protein
LAFIAKPDVQQSLFPALVKLSRFGHFYPNLVQTDIGISGHNENDSMDSSVFGFAEESGI